VNENDISTTPEQLFDDNDQLSAHVAHYTNADILIILSDIDGYYEEMFLCNGYNLTSAREFLFEDFYNTLEDMVKTLHTTKSDLIRKAVVYYRGALEKEIN